MTQQYTHSITKEAISELPLEEFTGRIRQMYFVEEGADLSPIACAYIRARGADRLCSYGDWAALSDVCDAATARYLKYEVSDGIIAPGYTDEALEILKTKKKGNYNVVQIDPDYVPAPQEYKDAFGVTFQQGRNNFEINEALLTNLVTENRDLPEAAKRDMIVALITLKYTQSNSVCYVKDGQAIGVGAGQQSRIHCTRLAGGKADTWFLRQHPKTLNLPFLSTLGRPERDNVIDSYINGNEEDVCADGYWQNYFTTQPEPLTQRDRVSFLSTFNNVALGSDAFFPFPDNIERARRSGVRYVAQPGGSEHHTGYALDLNIYHSDGTSEEYDGTGEYAWINDNCQNYGLVVRYATDKADITGIGNEPWHFRYVGIPHATQMVKEGLCLEEYIDYLKDFTAQGEHLMIECVSGTYEVWYAQGSAIYLPDSGEYTVSGNNVDGYIITEWRG